MSVWLLVLAMLLLMMRSAWHVVMPSAMGADIDDGDADPLSAANASADAELFGSEVDSRGVASSAMVPSPAMHTEQMKLEMKQFSTKRHMFFTLAAHVHQQSFRLIGGVTSVSCSS